VNTYHESELNPRIRRDIDTLDKISVQRALKLHPLIRMEVIKGMHLCKEGGTPIRIVQGARTIAYQNSLYAQGRTQKQLDRVGLSRVKAKPHLPKVTNARGGDSFHNYFFCFDFCLLRGKRQVSWSRQEDLDQDGQKDWDEVVDVFLQLGFDWGGNWSSFPDYPHMQRLFGLTLRKAKELYAQKKVDSHGFLIIG